MVQESTCLIQLRRKKVRVSTNIFYYIVKVIKSLIQLGREEVRVSAKKFYYIIKVIKSSKEKKNYIIRFSWHFNKRPIKPPKLVPKPTTTKILIQSNTLGNKYSRFTKIVT